MGKHAFFMTPRWAAHELPETVELVRIHGVWHLILWTEDHAVAQPHADDFAFQHKDSADWDDNELEVWFAPRKHVHELAVSLADEADTSEATGGVFESAGDISDK